MGRIASELKVVECHDIIFDEFSRFKDHRPLALIRLEDFLMSAFAVFALKCPSLLSFEKIFQISDAREANLKRLFRLEQVPSDTQLRDVMDFVDSSQYREVFKSLFAYIQRSKMLEKFVFMELQGTPYYLLAVDGTGYFRSEKIRCHDCLTFEHIDADKQAVLKFGHNMLAGSLVVPTLKQVIPMCPEQIVLQDGASKNDSELSAFKRFMSDLRQEHPKLKLIVTLDALYANAPVIQLLGEAGYRFIIGVKNTKGTLFAEVNEGEASGKTQRLERSYLRGEKIIKTTKLKFRFANSVRLQQDKDSPYVNFVEVEDHLSWTDKDGEYIEEKKTFTFITDIVVTATNVEKLAEGGRTRWKIENETFNTLKNGGYHLEHNYGHGDYNLSKNFILSMFLAFLVDQIQELSCVKFKQLRLKFDTKKLLWQFMATGLDWVDFDSWDGLYNKLAGFKDRRDSS